jgi:hypothetical protein
MNPEVKIRPDICKHKNIQDIYFYSDIKIVKCLDCLKILVIEE